MSPIERGNGHSALALTSLERFLPPTITRSLQASYRYQPGEQLHFLVEYTSPTLECQSVWQIQRSTDATAAPIEDGLIVNADCSSILIIESISAQLQGLYTFLVENLYGRAMTQTLVIVNTNAAEDDDDTPRRYTSVAAVRFAAVCSLTQEYNEIQEETASKRKDLVVYHSNGSSDKRPPAIRESSSGDSSEYEELKMHSSQGKSTSSMSTTDEEPAAPPVRSTTSATCTFLCSFQINGNGNDLYSQRHIAYFDPSPQLAHVEPIEQFDNDDSACARMPTNVSFHRSSTIC